MTRTEISQKPLAQITASTASSLLSAKVTVRLEAPEP
jgi:hypothetical protein